VDESILMKKQKNGNQRKSRTIWIITSGLIVVLVAWLISRSQIGNEKGGSLRTLEVVRGPIEQAVESVGVLKSEPTALLTWEMDGIPATYDLRVGDIVQKGDNLMALETSSQSPEVLQAQTALLDAQTELEKVQVSDAQFQEILKELTTQEVILLHKYSLRDQWNMGGSSDERVDAALADYEEAELIVWEMEDQYEAVKSLAEDDSQRVTAYEALEEAIYVRDILERALNQILDHQYDHDVETDFIVYQQQLALVAELRAAYYRYVDNNEEISAARAEVQALQNTVDQARIIAPFDGTVTEIFVYPGQAVSKEDTAVQINDLENLVIELSIPQTEINDLKIGQDARITFDAIPAREYQGYVQEIAAAGSEAGGQITFTVTIRVVDADELVKMGFTAHVEIITNYVEDALLIPNQAVFYDEKGAVYVMLENENKSISETYIETGARSDAYTELASGDISVGDMLIVNQVDVIKFQAGSGQALIAARRTFR